jgi:hypothetical protein
MAPPHTEKPSVVKLGLVNKNVCVDVGGNTEVSLPDEIADPRPRFAAHVEQIDSAVPEVMRRPERNAGGPAGFRYRGPQGVSS